MPSKSSPPSGAARARFAVAVLFFTNGASFANLVPRYPEIKATLDLTNTAFGAAVAAFPLGALIAGLAAGALIRRYRSSRVAIAATGFSAFAFVLAAAAPSWAILALGIFLAGAMDSIADVAQNSHGLRVQKLYGRSIINSLHAVWSMGAVVGGVMGAAVAQAGVPVIVHIAGSSVLFALAALAVYRWLLPGPEPRDIVAAPKATATGDSAPRRRLPAGALAKWGVLAALVIIAASAAVAEDSGASWAAIYLSGDLNSSLFVAGLGFIALQGAQFVGRIIGDPLVDRFGQRAVARTGGIVVLLGMGTALAAPSVPTTILGFALAGFGVATLIPAAMHGADELPGFAPGQGLTIVSWLLRIGFLVSPPLVGAIADASSLRYGLLVVPLAGLLVIVFSQVLETRRRAVTS